jgi:hypothetical protein
VVLRQVRHKEGGPNHRTSSQNLVRLGKNKNFSHGQDDDRGMHRVGSEHLSALLLTAELDEKAAKESPFSVATHTALSAIAPFRMRKVLGSGGRRPIVTEHEHVSELHS